MKLKGKKIQISGHKSSFFFDFIKQSNVSLQFHGYFILKLSMSFKNILIDNLYFFLGRVKSCRENAKSKTSVFYKEYYYKVY